jgi:hypothetical protein
VAAVAGRLARAGIDSLLVRVLTVNPNRPFYKRLGGRYLREEPYDWNGVMFAMEVSGWPDTTTLQRLSRPSAS